MTGGDPNQLDKRSWHDRPRVAWAVTACEILACAGIYITYKMDAALGLPAAGTAAAAAAAPPALSWQLVTHGIDAIMVTMMNLSTSRNTRFDTNTVM